MTFKEKILQFQKGNLNVFGGKEGGFRTIEINEAGYAELVQLLEHKESDYRFWALDLLIKNAPDRMAERHEALKSTIYNLLFDDCTPCSDRAQWAMNILGMPGLEYMLNRYHGPEVANPATLLHIIARHSEAGKNSDQIIRILYDALDHENRDMRFVAMVSFMDSSPLRAALGHPQFQVDYEKIYRQILPVAIEMKREGGYFAEWGMRYIELIKTNKEHPA
jgi:hypothetical protein